MILRHSNRALAGAIVLSILGGQSALAAGFEKSILWSGKYAGQGGAAVSTSSGAEALFFNPANLAGSTGSEVSVNVSPTFSKFSGPVATENTTVNGVQTISPIFGALASYSLNENMTFGIGSYVSGGAKAKYENVPLSGSFTMKLNPETDLSALEYAAGLGYQVAPGFKVGASVRYAQVKAKLVSAATSVSGNAVTVTEVTLSDMKASKFGGFRVGASYDGGSWGFGAAYRSAVDFTANGTATARYETAPPGGTINTTAGFAASITSTLPYQLSAGGHYKWSDSLTFVGEGSITNYKKVDKLDLAGTVPVGGGSPLNDITTEWADQKQVRVGGIYALSGDTTIRAGYVLTGIVTPAKYARPTLTPPGNAHSITAGISTMMNGNMELSAAAEYAMASGTGTGDTTAQTKAGNYSASGYMLHTGVNYRF
jgi:long-chain fatty acid transport protein